MLRSDFRKALEGQQQILVLLWIFFVGAIFVYLWLTEFILGRGGFWAASSLTGSLRVVLWLLAFADLGTFVWWRKRFLARNALLAGSKKYKVLQGLQEHQTPLEERAAEIVSSYVTSKIVGFAILEAMAVYGFVSAVVGGYIYDQYLLSVVAGALLLFEFPSKPFLEGILSDLEARG